MEIPYQIHVHHNKTLKDYFFDFFMLFFAVTLGFFVENTREDIAKNKKEKEYMRSMISDLIEDTVKINASLWYNSYYITGVDSLINLIYQYKPNDTSIIKNIYQKYMAYGRNNNLVRFTDRTITQLKSSGSFSSLKTGVSDSLLIYEETIKNATLIENIYKDNLTKSLDLSTRIFDYRYLRFNVNFIARNYNVYQSQPTYKLLTNDSLVLSQYANTLELWRHVILGYIFSLQAVKSKAQSLVPFLQKEYNIN